ncbi:MAG: hypothetical protein ACRD2B_04710 [Terriglobia bacterium]
MFQMIDEEPHSSGDRKIFMYKVGAFVAALGGVGVFLYFLVTSHYLRG